MSFADELRAAQLKLQKQKREEEQRSKGRRRVASTTGGGSAATKSEWSLEDDMIALYLQMSESSQFLVENYSKKRKLSPRSMKMRMNQYASLIKNKSADVPSQMQKVFQQFGQMKAPELQKLVIAILRGEYQHQEVIRRD